MAHFSQTAARRLGRLRLAFWLLAACSCASALPTLVRAQDAVGEIPLADVLEVLVVDRDLLAIDARSGGQIAERLRLDEQVVWQGARGKVGLIITNQRVLAVAVRSGSWQQIDYGRTELAPTSALLGERVAIAITSERVLGFNGGSGNLVEYRLGPRERIVDARTGENVGVVVTDRQALGLSPFVGGFFPIPLSIGDPIDAVSAQSNLATLTLGRRLLIFRATTGSWEERARDLR
jgi:hypothetical protein